MIEKRITLEVAAFADSEAAAALALLPKEARELVRRFLQCVIGDLGKAPQLLEGDEMAQVLRELLPRRFGRKDPLAAHAGRVLNAYLDDLEGRYMVAHAYDVRVALDANVDAFAAAVARGSGDPAAVTTAPIQSRGEKVGRNDPCPCGSGRKFKKCCGG